MGSPGVASVSLRHRYVHLTVLLSYQAELANLIGNTPSSFVQLETLGTANRHLKAIDALHDTARDPAIICLNDDVHSNAEKYVRPVLRTWLDRKWPHAPEWET